MINRIKPQRPRQHQLESESRIAFKSAIPSAWVCRDLDQDYGIDSEVELFDDSGIATGAKFLVQLKATDEQDLKKALRLRIAYSKGEYYSSLGLPVLIVRYHAPTHSLFVRWFHGLDPYYGNRSQSGFTFQLTEDDRWDRSTPAHLVEDVTAFREVRSPRLSIPLRFSLITENDEIHGIPAYRLRIKLQQLFSEVPDLLKLIQANDSISTSSYSVSINNERWEVRVGGSNGFTLHTPHGYVGGKAESTLPYDIMLGIGMALDWHGHPIEGASIISPFWKLSRLAREPKTAISAAQCLARANQMHSALEIAEEFFRDDETIDAAQIFLMPFLSRQIGKTSSEQDFGIRILNRIAQAVENRGDQIRASVLNYNSANMLRSMKRFREAIHHYREAARLDERYLKRSYYLIELAGALFMSRRYRLAARIYKQALDIEKNKHVTCLYADALMFSGKYQEAEKLFARSLSKPVPPDDAEWALKRYALSWLRNETGLDEQKRSSPIYPPTFKPKEMQDSEIERICKGALKNDALSALAWYNLAGVRHRAGDIEAAANNFLLAALIVPWDLEAWGNVIGLAKNSNNVDLFGHSLAAAYSINGDDFLNHMAERVSENREKFIATLAEVGNILPARNRDVTLRVHHADHGWAEVHLSHSGENRNPLKKDE